jgi:hypothetical protein
MCINMTIKESLLGWLESHDNPCFLSGGLSVRVRGLLRVLDNTLSIYIPL